MIENVIGWLLLAIIFAVPIYFCIKTFVVMRRINRERQEALERIESEYTALKAREDYRMRTAKKQVTGTAVAAGGGGGSGYTTTYVPSTQVSNSSRSEDFMDAAMVAMFVSQLASNSHADTPRETVKESPREAITYSSSDSEDQKAVRDTFDSSSSWSSSSDSGPSSDW